LAEFETISIDTIKNVTVAQILSANVLDAQQIDKIGKDLYKLADDEFIKRLVLDMQNVKHLSSGALGMLINLQRKTETTKGQLIMCGMRPQILQIFKLTKLEKLFKFEKDRNEALKAFGILAPPSAR